jgi:hypothetical protein
VRKYVIMRNVGAAMVAGALLWLAGCAISGQHVTPGSKSLGGASSPASATPARDQPTAPPTFKVGATAHLTRSNGAVADITLSDARTAQPGEFDQPAHGGYVVVTVQIAATAGQLSYNALYFKLSGPDGTEYNSAYVPDAGEELNSGTLYAGRQVKGVLVWDAPASILGHATITETGEDLDPMLFWSC